MSAEGSVSEIGYVSLHTRDLGATLTNAIDVFGLVESDSSGKKAFLTAQNKHHEIVYTQSDKDALDHTGLIVDSTAELEAIREKVARGGYQVISEQPIEDHIEEGFAFVGPDFTDVKYFGEGQGIAVRKGDKALADKISAAILAIRANGKYKEVQDKYFDFDVYGE